MIRASTIAVLLFATATLAQPAITIDVENPVLLPGESTTVTLLAGFDPSDYAMNGVDTDFVTTVGSEGWSDAQLVAPMDGPGTTRGLPSATGYDEIIAGQLNFPATGGIFADPTNPIAFWRATYTAPTDVTMPLEVDLSTMTRRYTVFIASSSASSESRIDELVEGAATIRVVPAPASSLVLAAGLAGVRRRR